MYGPNTLDLIAYHRRPRMPRQEGGETARFAIYPRVGALEKPVVYRDLPALCRAIHRARGDRPIDLQDIELPLRDGAEPIACVSVWLTTDDGVPGSNAGDFIGTAWLDGGDRQQLANALRRAEPPRLPNYAFEAEAFA